MQSSANDSSQADRIADFLADCEGLKGAARRVFLQQLREVFGFRATVPRRITWLLSALALLVACFGLFVELSVGLGTRAALNWLCIATVGQTLAVAVARSGSLAKTVDCEFEWRAYCLLVRPTILRRRPGLLDRNLSLDRGTEEVFIAPRRAAMRPILSRLNLDFWVSTGIGWALGSIGAIAWRIAIGPGIWIGVLPVSGAIFGPPAWAIFRLTVFRWLQHAASEQR